MWNVLEKIFNIIINLIINSIFVSIRIIIINADYSHMMYKAWYNQAGRILGTVVIEKVTCYVKLEKQSKIIY